MKAYKGFNPDMTCRGFQYEEGKTYTTEEARLCESGFHACESPLDCYRYYEPSKAVYHEVELDDVSEEKGQDTKRVAKKIKIGARLSVADICKAQFDYVKEHCTEEHTDPKMATAGDSGAATAGDFGAATAGDRGAATAGDFGAATSRGSSASGLNGLSVARGTFGKVRVKGGKGAVLVIAAEPFNSYDILFWKAGVVDGEALKADTWYTLDEHGEWVEA